MSGILITMIGMGFVFAFLFLLMWAIQLMSYIIQKTDTDLDAVAATIAIALDKGDSK